jgi:type VI secretion system protein ImpF
MTEARHRQLPSLLDRLSDEQPELQQESIDARAMTRNAYRQSVLRDLEHLLNATSPLRVADSHPVSQSVLAYGMPPIAGQLASHLDIRKFEDIVARLIQRFENRIDPASVRVHAESDSGLLNNHNVVGLRISGKLWAQPYPVELMLRSEVDLESGRVSLQALGSGPNG